MFVDRLFDAAESTIDARTRILTAEWMDLALVAPLAFQQVRVRPPMAIPRNHLPSAMVVGQRSAAGATTAPRPVEAPRTPCEDEWTEAEGWPLYSGTLVGPQAVVEKVFMRLGEIGDNFAVKLVHLVADGDTVVALGTYSWNRKGSGERAEVKMAHVWTLANQKVTRFQQHVDTAKERHLIA